MTVRMVVVDDHPLVRAGFRFLAESRPELDLVGEAATGVDAIEVCLQLQPDVVVMDIALGPSDGETADGIAAAQAIRRDTPTTRVLFVTMHDDEATVLAALRAGASGYVLKGTHQDDLVRAIIGAAAGELVLGPQAALIVADRLAGIEPARPRLAHLTDREHEVLELMAAVGPMAPSPVRSASPARPSPTTSPTSWPS